MAGNLPVCVPFAGCATSGLRNVLGWQRRIRREKKQVKRAQCHSSVFVVNVWMCVHAAGACCSYSRASLVHLKADVCDAQEANSCTCVRATKYARASKLASVEWSTTRTVQLCYLKQTYLQSPDRHHNLQRETLTRGSHHCLSLINSWAWLDAKDKKIRLTKTHAGYDISPIVCHWRPEASFSLSAAFALSYLVYFGVMTAGGLLNNSGYVFMSRE